MEMSMTGQSVVFLFSCAVGGLLGAFYDVFRIIRIAFNSKWLTVFFQDLFFCVMSSFSIILLVFHTNSGTVRWFSLLGCFLCFVLYHMTVGKLVMLAAKIIIGFIKKVLDYIYKITVIPLKTAILYIVKQITKLCGFILRIFNKTRDGLYYKSRKRSMAESASKGFGLYKNNKSLSKKTAKSIAKITGKDSAKTHKAIEKMKGKIR